MRARIGVAAALVVATLASPAWGHAELKTSAPARSDALDAVPETVDIEFTEPPTANAKVTVLDGCGDDVAGEVTTESTSLTATVSKGQPGKWKVRYNVVSGLDGHPTSGSFAFSVKGKADCSQARGPREAEEKGSGTLVLSLVFGGLALALIAWAAWGRRRTS